MVSIVPAAGELKWTVLFNAVDTSERFKICGLLIANSQHVNFTGVSDPGSKRLGEGAAWHYMKACRA